jgi:hypothetical protein
MQKERCMLSFLILKIKCAFYLLKDCREFQSFKVCCGYTTYCSLMFCQQYSGESASVLMMVDLETFDN